MPGAPRAVAAGANVAALAIDPPGEPSFCVDPREHDPASSSSRPGATAWPGVDPTAERGPLDVDRAGRSSLDAVA